MLIIYFTVNGHFYVDINFYKAEFVVSDFWYKFTTPWLSPLPNTQKQMNILESQIFASDQSLLLLA